MPLRPGYIHRETQKCAISQIRDVEEDEELPSRFLIALSTLTTRTRRQVEIEETRVILTAVIHFNINIITFRITLLFDGDTSLKRHRCFRSSRHTAYTVFEDGRNIEQSSNEVGITLFSSSTNSIGVGTRERAFNIAIKLFLSFATLDHKGIVASCNQAAHSAFAMCGSPCAVRHVPFATPRSEGRGVLLEGHPATANRPPALSVNGTLKVEDL
ncbi:hypothetical protein V1478_013564 [Vespula squamosa]|uniref:Uncharacterized protein n=1 Tax=Vespula squamosa TaxID=30214 RepID=A0ABD2A5H8_VESSQ